VDGAAGMAVLPATIAGSRTGDLTFLVTERGAPFVKEGFGNWFRAACRAAGCPGSAHGLRKAGATRAAENGATIHQLMAPFGWKTEKMALVYTPQGRPKAPRRNRRPAAPTVPRGTGNERKSPAPWVRCGRQRRKLNDINGKSSRWCQERTRRVIASYWRSWTPGPTFAHDTNKNTNKSDV
jgi:hypothetical protein